MIVKFPLPNSGPAPALQYVRAFLLASFKSSAGEKSIFLVNVLYCLHTLNVLLMCVTGIDGFLYIAHFMLVHAFGMDDMTLQT